MHRSDLALDTCCASVDAVEPVPARQSPCAIRSGGLTGEAGPVRWQAPALERRQGEAILLDPRDRRAMRQGGLSVLMLGGSPADLMLQGFVLNDLAEIGRVETSVEPFAAFEAPACRPAEHDLVFISRCHAGIEAFTFGERLARRLAASGAQPPLLVLLADRFSAEDIALSETCGAFAARLLKPLCHDHCRALLLRLFRP